MRRRKKLKGKTTFHVNKNGKFVEMPDKRLKLTHSCYAIAHTKEHLTYERLNEHLIQLAIDPKDFWETVSVFEHDNDMDIYLESLQLVEIDTLNL